MLHYIEQEKLQDNFDMYYTVNIITYCQVILQVLNRNILIFSITIVWKIKKNVSGSATTSKGGRDDNFNKETSFKNTYCLIKTIRPSAVCSNMFLEH